MVSDMDARTNKFLQDASVRSTHRRALGERLLSRQLRRLVKRGRLVVHFPSGHCVTFGDGRSPTARVRVTSTTTLRRLVTNPFLALGEAYMDGTLVVGNEDIYGLLALLQQNLVAWPRSVVWSASSWMRHRLRGTKQKSTSPRARRNVAHHYDLSSDFYALFLDEDWQYSCAYFQHAEDTLAQAQKKKKEIIAQKLLLEPGQRVLDIGCGWGGLGLHLAREHRVDVTGVTLSREQLRIAQNRAMDAGLGTSVHFKFEDYRDVKGTFDRIVSVGMFEHVGVPQYAQFFDALRDRLAEDGVALLHTIGRADGPGATDPWIEKYIFPGGYSPALSEISSAVECSGLIITDIEVWRLHYASTLKAWRERFEANLDQIRKIYDERFCRMWRYYLAASELAFRNDGHVIYQIQLAKRQDAVPLTRDYLNSGDRSACEPKNASDRLA